MYTQRPLFTRRGMAEYRQTIKGRLKHWRKLCNLSQVQAAKVAGVARSTWQAWENPARSALPDVAALAADGKKRAGILATDGTVQTGIYQRECAARGMEGVTPPADVQKLVMSIIYDEIKRGEKGSREKFAAIDRWLRGSGCDAAILGCTELSVYRTYHGLPDYYLDAMEILAERCITACGYKLRMV